MTHQAFQLTRAERVPSLSLRVEEYRHRATGAAHIHLGAEDDNNAFLVAFLTVPQDSTGVAHILEHTTLCGSERFPVRDPFFMMIRRSLNTFMNAFTANDWTAYPFASQNRKDFYNLLQVYLDAVFFPRLDPLDFAQEGHRLEFAAPDDPAAPLVYRGVVYNEMKGAMSSPISQVSHSLQAHLFPTVTYHYNSGGDPAAIPTLTYDQLREFHARHYHPSNALFITYGNLPADDHQAYFEDCALQRFSGKEMRLVVPDERRYPEPLVVQDSYSLDTEEDSRDKTHVVLGWLLGRNSDPHELLCAHLLSGVLLDNSASPLRHALETTPLGSSPSELCGLEDSTHEMSFACGLEGSNPECSAEVEDLVLNVLRDVAEKGLPQDQVESVLHQLELHQREIQGGGFPYGLRLMVNVLAPTLHGGDPVAALDIDPLLARLRESIKDPSFIKGLVRKWLLDNPHRVRLTMVPDTELGARREADERRRLAACKAALEAGEEQHLVGLARRLAARQNAQDDPEILPRVGLEDVPADLKIAEGETFELAGEHAAWYSQGTNGMVYQQVVVDLPALEEELLDVLPLFCECLTEVGSGGRDYLATQARQAAVTGGIVARYSVRAAVSDVQRGRGVLVLAGKALTRNHAALSELLRETLLEARFDELKRLRELIAQTRAGRESSVTDHGHALAMIAATAGMSPFAALAHRWDGLLGLKRLKALDEALADQPSLAAFAARLERLRDVIAAAPRQFLLVGEASGRESVTQAAQSVWAEVENRSASAPLFAPEPITATVRDAWVASTQVSFCAKAYATVALDHPDAAALTVLGGFLRNGYLHRAIREQGGAYGAGASYDADSGAFRFYSYRDPRLAGTLDDFDRSLVWLQTTDHPWRAVEEAILGVVGQIDRPDSPAGEAIGAFFSALHGRTPEQRRRFRSRVLAVTVEDLRRVAALYLKPQLASVAVLSDLRTVERHADLGLEVRRL